MMKSRKLSLTQVRRILTQIAFNPRTPGPMRIVSEMEDSNYYERQAQVLIEEARTERIISEDSDYNEKMIQATRLLILAILCH